MVLRPAAGALDLCVARRARRADRLRRGLRRVLFSGYGAPIDPAEPAGEGAAAGLSRRALRRARDGGVAVRSALEGRAGSARRPSWLSPDEPGQVPRPVVVAWQGAGGVRALGGVGH